MTEGVESCSNAMVDRMTINIDIDDVSFAKLKGEAELKAMTVSEVVQAALVAFLASDSSKRRRLPSFHSGGHLVDIADRNTLYDLMDQDEEKFY